MCIVKAKGSLTLIFILTLTGSLKTDGVLKWKRAPYKKGG